MYTPDLNRFIKSLSVAHLLVNTILPDELIMCARFDDTTPEKDANLISIANGRQTMGNRYSNAIAVSGSVS